MTGLETQLADALAEAKLRAVEILLELMDDPNTDPLERRRAASAILRTKPQNTGDDEDADPDDDNPDPDDPDDSNDNNNNDNNDNNDDNSHDPSAPDTNDAPDSPAPTLRFGNLAISPFGPLPHPNEPFAQPNGAAPPTSKSLHSPSRSLPVAHITYHSLSLPRPTARAPPPTDDDINPAGVPPMKTGPAGFLGVKRSMCGVGTVDGEEPSDETHVHLSGHDSRQP